MHHAGKAPAAIRNPSARRHRAPLPRSCRPCQRSRGRDFFPRPDAAKLRRSPAQIRCCCQHRETSSCGFPSAHRAAIHLRAPRPAPECQSRTVVSHPSFPLHFLYPAPPVRLPQAPAPVFLQALQWFRGAQKAARASRPAVPCTRTVAPVASIDWRTSGDVVSGTTIVTGMPSARPV